MSSPGQELSRWSRLARFQVKLWKFCLRRLKEHNAAAMAAALSFRTIFAMVPVLVLAMLVLRGMGAVEMGKDRLRELLAKTGFDEIRIVHDGEASRVSTQAVGGQEAISVSGEIEDLVDRVSEKLTVGRIGPLGALLLVWTALALLTTAERSLNRIFEAERSRPFFRRIMIYWATVTLVPVVLLAAGYLGEKAGQSFQQDAWSWLLDVVAWLGPFVVGVVTLAAVYKLLPNTSVQYSSAVSGAIVAVPLWMLAKWGFTAYVGGIVARGSIYGVLGLIPLFLLWLHLSWMIILFGAEVAHTATHISDMEAAERARRLELGPHELLAAAIAVGRNYRLGRGPASTQIVARQLRLSDEATNRLLYRLGKLDVVTPMEKEDRMRWILSRPADQIRLLDAMGLARRTEENRKMRRAIRQALSRVQRKTRQSLGSVSLADILEQSDRPGRKEADDEEPKED